MFVEAIETIKIRHKGFDLQVISRDGNFNSTLMLTIKFACGMDLINFPNDTQTCTLSFVAVKPGNLEFDSKFEDSDSYVKSEEWEVVDKIAHKPQTAVNTVRIVYEITIHRTSKFFQKFVITPVVIIYLMSSLVFLIPVEASNKVDFIMTVFLAQTILFGQYDEFIPLGASSLPKNANSSLYLVVYMAILCCVAVLSKCFFKPLYQSLSVH